MFDQDMRTQIAVTAKSLNVLPAALLAVVEVESAGRIGARVNGRMEPMIRFEGHYFHRLLHKSLRPIAKKKHLVPIFFVDSKGLFELYTVHQRGRRAAGDNIARSYDIPGKASPWGENLP